jgi:membrane peptidoglycan carboxypeptidase
MPPRRPPPLPPEDPEEPPPRKKRAAREGAPASKEGPEEAPKAAKPKARKVVQRKRSGPRGGTSPRAWALLVLLGFALGLLITAALLYGDARSQVRTWQDRPPAVRPTTVWSAPMLLRAGDPVDAELLARDLRAAGYEPGSSLDHRDQFVREGGLFKVWSGPAKGPGWAVDEVKGSVRVEGGRVADVSPKAGLQLHPTTLAVIGDLEARRTPLRLADLSPWMVPALLAIEDTRFRDHGGVDPIGVTRAVLANLLGRSTQGGSTLTQQLAKNLFLGAERTLQRKVREAFLAAALEGELAKDELLELYLSEVYLGHADGMPLFGVEQAARTWFGKPASRLDVAECATIAGVIASPNAWSPTRDLEAARTRRDVVIGRMVAVRALTEAQAAEAVATPLEIVPVDVGAGWETPWAVAAALDTASDLLGEAFTGGSGLAVYASVQPHLQRTLEATAATSMEALDAHKPEARGSEVAIAAVRASDGAVVALVGGRSFAKSPFHRAINAWREAGSTIKPLTVLAALDRDPALGPSTRLTDQPITRVHDGKRWTPRNYDGSYRGEVTLRSAVETSRNIPMVLLAEKLGWTDLQRHLVKAGLTKATDLPSASLGGFPTQVVELAGAYTAFQRAGAASRPRLVLGIADAGGRSLYTSAPSTARLGSARAAAITRHLLEGVLTDGTARAAADLGVSGAFGGKTGTTDNARDAWFVGFDPELSVAVWIGPDRGTLGLTGAEAALPVWAQVMQVLGAPRGRFGDPDELVAVPVCATTGLPPCPGCARVRTEHFARGQVPAADCSAPPPAAASAPEVPAAPEAPAPVEVPAPPAAAKPDDAPEKPRREAKEAKEPGKAPKP